jgi:probable F420-dependent oxidoreductase
VKLGVTFPHNIEPDGASVAAFARDLEAAGFDYLCALDHVVGAHPDAFRGEPYFYTHENPTHEVLTLFAYAAAVTQRIEFATTAMILTQRQTVLVAKQAAEVQMLSNGRLRLGVVVGWNRPESEAMGADFRTRGRRIEEQIEVLRSLWRQPLVSFEGAFHHLDRVGINPLPPSMPPLWIGGGYEDFMLRRVAKYADGWLPSLAGTQPGPRPPRPLGRARRRVPGSWRDSPCHPPACDSQRAGAVGERPGGAGSSDKGGSSS